MRAAKFVGIDVEIAQAIAEKLDKELKIEDMEFGAIIDAVASGKADMGVAGMTVREDRLENANFSDPYTTCHAGHHRAGRLRHHRSRPPGR